MTEKFIKKIKPEIIIIIIVVFLLAVYLFVWPIIRERWAEEEQLAEPEIAVEEEVDRILPGQ